MQHAMGLFFTASFFTLAYWGVEFTRGRNHHEKDNICYKGAIRADYIGNPDTFSSV